MTLSIKRYGWKRDEPDHRDLLYRAVHHVPGIVHPPKVNLKPKLSLVFDQGELGSCTANASCFDWQFVHGAPADGSGCWSRMFVYIESLVYEGSYPNDEGAQIRDVVKVLATKGVPSEKDWPYRPELFPELPPGNVVTDAATDKVTVYSRLMGREDFLNCLASGFPFILGFTVYDSFESDAVAKTGIMSMPKPGEGVVGGHAVCCIGYDQNFHGTGKLWYLIQNSWGPSWGDKTNPGCFWMPAEYLENTSLASDFWTLRNGK